MRRENYGIDAPTIVRNMALGSQICAVLWAASMFLQEGLLHDLGSIFQGPCIGMIVGTSWMLASSLWLKQIVRDRLLDSRGGGVTSRRSTSAAAAGSSRSASRAG